MNLAMEVLRLFAEGTPTPVPVPKEPEAGIVDQLVKLINSLGGLLTAVGSTSGVVAVILSARQLRRLGSSNSANPPPPPGSGTTPPAPPAGTGGNPT